RTLQATAQGYVDQGDTPRFLAAIDRLAKDKLFSYLEEKLDGIAAASILPALEELGEAALPLDTVVAQRFGPPVARRLEARKRAAGLYDFDDMLALVGEALSGPHGAELAATLRQRFKLAIVDEFQDTDPVQWEIFRTIFAEGAGRPLYLVGDPKQSIYGFRG